MGLFSPPKSESKSHSLIKAVAHSTNIKYQETKPGYSTEQALQHFGYILDRNNELGKGAFGLVITCRRFEPMAKPHSPINKFPGLDVNHGEPVLACKIIDAVDRTEKRIKDLKNELGTLRRTSHPFIIKYYDDFIIDTKFYIIMEYAENGDLKHYMGKYRKVSERKARRWFKQILSAIKHLHEHGIAHRDLKGENILLKRQMHEGKMRRVCKLSDFGLSAVSFTIEQGPILVSTACGTRPYMAPEILDEKVRKKKPYNPMKADIWALGVMLFQMITNQYPFNFQDLSTMIQLQKRHNLDFSKAPEATTEVKDLIHQILNPDPTARLTIHGIESHPWLVHHTKDSASSSSSSNGKSRSPASKRKEGQNVVSGMKSKENTQSVNKK